MEISVSGNEIIVKGNIKSLKDAEEIKSAIESLSNYNVIYLIIEDSISITSAVIGYLRMLTDEGKKINIRVGNEMLKDLLDDLGLTSLFNVVKV